MKTRATICACLISLLSPSVVFAEDGPYVSGNAGASWLSDADFAGSVPGIQIGSEVEFDTGIQVGAALGYDFGAFRAEGEFAYQSREFDEMKDIKLNGVPIGDVGADGDLDAFIFLANGFYDIDTDTNFTPYLGGGIGFAVIEVSDLFVPGIIRGDADDTVFAYQAAGGVTYAITDRFSADLSYRFVGTSEPDFGGLEELHSHNLMATIRFYLR